MRSIPSIEQLRQREAMQALERQYGRGALVDALRTEAAALRARMQAGETIDDAAGAIERGVAERLRIVTAPSLRRVINATGVIIHTNLGRAPLARAAVERIESSATGYTNLEYDLDAGGRGRRDVHAERLLCRLTGASAAVVVNNNAAATMIVLAALASGREVVISRGELIEIGGGFRVPDVMQQSGAVLREVGTTNRTRAADYAAAIGDRTALILRVHPSNFRIEGFTERPALEELVALGRRFNVPVVEDLGSGYLAALRSPGRDAGPGGGPTLRSGVHDAEAGPRPTAALTDEPVVSGSLARGVDVVMFSGDKLLGGPQAGIIAGTTDAVGRIRRHPLMRALRVDKLTYAALEATLEEYSSERAHESIPVVRMIALTAEEIGARADALASAVARPQLDVEVIDGFSTIGGGSAPGSQIPTRLVAIRHRIMTAADLAARLRHADVPVIARIENDRVLIDLRTVDSTDERGLLTLLRTI